MTIKEATVKRFHYDDHDQLRRHLADFVLAYNFGRRLKTLKASHHTNTSANAGRSRTIYPKSYPSNAGTKQLVRVQCPIERFNHGLAIERLAEEADDTCFQSALPDTFLGEGGDQNGWYLIAVCDQMIL